VEVPDLFNFQSDIVENVGGCLGLWSAMFQLTQDFCFMVLNPLLGIRGMANRVNPLLHDWYSKEKQYSGTNIVATDFFLESNIIDIAYKINKYKK